MFLKEEGNTEIFQYLYIYVLVLEATNDVQFMLHS